MPNPLDREWLPDSERMRSTTAWILKREPVLVRVAPVVILGFVAALTVWAARSTVDVYASIPASVSPLSGRAASDTLMVRFDAEDTRIVAGASVVVIPAGRGAETGGVKASILRVEPAMMGAAPVAIMVVAPGEPLPPGRATVRVAAGQRALLAEFVAAARGGRKSR